MHTLDAKPLEPDELEQLDRCWRATNYLSVGQIYLLANPLLREPLADEHVKPRLLGHWGTTPGLNLLYTHLNRVIAARDLDVIFITGPGHGGPALVANTWLEGSWTEHYPAVGRDADGMAQLFKQFSFPGGIPSHVAAEVPGSIHEGGELGYSLAHAFGAVFDSSDAIAACVIGDGEAETGPLATAWHSNKFLDPVGDGAVLPILHLNGYKIANPTIFDRIGDEELGELLHGYGWEPYLVAGDDPHLVHQQLAATLDATLDQIADIQRAARADGDRSRPRWPMIVLRTPKGWTGPKELGGKPVEGTWRSHQDVDEHLANEGRVMEILSEHTCQGWLEGYLLTGRHGLFSCYEAFIHIVDSMFNQHAKWLKVTRGLDWRRDIASLNYLLTSHVWRQDHNGFSHQDPGFIDHVVNKKADVIRVYLPPDTNCLLAVAEGCLRLRDTVNVIVSGKQPTPTWLDVDTALLHCARGIGIWEWASNDGGDPDVVLACAGDIPTVEVLAATSILRERLPDLRVRVVNVVDLMRLQCSSEHPHGLPDSQYDAIFTTDKPVIFAYHGYPWLIHRLTYRRTGHPNLHVRGYKEEGTTTTPFDMLVMNDVDRYHLVMDVIDRVPGLATRAATLHQDMADMRTLHRRHTRAEGEDLPDVVQWRWSGTSGSRG